MTPPPSKRRSPSRGRRGQPLAGHRIAVLGAGAVGAALAEGLVRAGADLRLWSRDGRRASRVRRRILGHVPAAAGKRLAAGGRLEPALDGARILLLCVADDALGDVAERVARAEPGAGIALHTNGFHGPEVLEPLARAGRPTGVFHPLAPLPPRGARASHLAGAWFALAGAPAARTAGRRLLRALDGRELRLAPGGQGAYHSAASLASGGVVAVFAAALEAFESAVEDPAAGRAALSDLVRRTWDNLATRAPRDALTGPASRGAVGVVRAQLEALAAQGAGAGEAEDLYRALLPTMLRLGVERGTVTPRQRREILRRLT